jgi:hypothetical protein
MSTQQEKKPFHKKWWFWAVIALVIIIGAASQGNKSSSSGGSNDVAGSADEGNGATVELQTEEGGGYASSYGTSFYAFDKDVATLACINALTMNWELTTANYKIDEASSSITFSGWSRSSVDIINYSGSKATYKVKDGKITTLVFENGDEFSWENVKQ